jgi:PAS domain S-box-containing protein
MKAQAHAGSGASRELPQALLERAPVGIVWIGGDGRFADANPRMQQITGRSAEELAGLGWSGIAHPVDGSRGASLLQELARGERSELHFEDQVLRPDASWVWVGVNAVPLGDGRGGVVAVVRDVTAERLDAEALRRSEQRFRRLIEKLPFGAYTIDREGLITYYNDRAVQLWGRAPKLHHPDDRWCGSFKLFAGDGTPLALEHSHMARALSEGRDQHGKEIIVERPDGSRAHVLAHAGPLRDDTGRVIGGMNVLVDVTSLKHAESLLSGSEQRFAQFMHHLPGFAWIKDAEGRYVFINTAIERSIEKNNRVLSGYTDAEVFKPEVAAEFSENDRRVLLTGAAFEAIETAELEDGLRHWLVNKFPIPGPDGSPAHVGGVALDVTESVRNREALLEADRRKDELLAELAVALRDPLAPIRAALAGLRASGAEPAALAELERQVCRLEAVADGLREKK